MSGDLAIPPREELERLESALARALDTGDASGLELLGYGEISCVVRWTWAGEAFACKRLPAFDGEARYAAYAACFDDYLAALTSRGVTPAPSRLVALDGPGGGRLAWCVQPELPAGGLLPQYLRAAGEEDARRVLASVLDRVDAAARGDLGVDGQISNWALVDGELLYLDVTTPLLRDASGAERLDTDLFMASLPWALRWPVKRLMLRKILDKYYEPRGVALDLLGNLIKERLEHLLPAFLDAVASRYSPRLTAEEVRAYYKDDAGTWELLQRLRRADRFWQTRVRRRTYPFLLPGRIER